MDDKESNTIIKYRKLVFLIVVLLLAFFINYKFKIIDYKDIDQLIKFHEWIEKQGFLAPIIFIICYSLGIVFLLPNPFFMIIGGLAFGAIWGILYVSIGFLIGAGLAFLISRYFAKNKLKKLLQKKNMEFKLKKWFDKDGYYILLITRAIPLFPINLQNYGYGLIDIKFSYYLILSLLGLLPKIFFLTVISGLLVEIEFMIKDNYQLFLNPLLITVFLYFIIYKYFANKRDLFNEESTKDIDNEIE